MTTQLLENHPIVSIAIRSFVNRSTRIIAVAALLLTASVGSLQLSSRADDPSEAQSDKQISTEAADESRKMAIRVLSETGQPIAQANVHVSIWEIKPTGNFPTRSYATNEQGKAEILIPNRIRILRIWPSKAGYVPQFVNFAQGMHEDGRGIPDAYEFQLQPGHRLSGRVVDDVGKPISAAKVQVRVESNEPPWGVNPKPMISTWLANGGDAAVTDEDGRWEITNAPAPKDHSDFQFRLQFAHPGFAGDTRWGELQERQGITTDQLRAGTARLTMYRGIAVTGSITGPDDEPVTSGLVIWDDRPYWATGVNETQIDEQGRYKTLRLTAGDYPVTVVAPGYAPTERTISVSQSLSHQREGI